MRFASLSLVACVLTGLLGACSSRGGPSDDELRGAYPGGSISDSIETKSTQVDDPAPEFLRGDGHIVGHGISIPFSEPRADGSRLVHRWGPWAYAYLQDGTDRDDFDSLAMESQGEFRDGHREGRWRFWHRNGKLRAEGEFVHSRMSGPWIVRNEDGSVDEARTGEYVDGRRM